MIDLGDHHAHSSPQGLGKHFNELGESPGTVVEFITAPNILQIIKSDLNEFFEILLVYNFQVDPLFLHFLVAVQNEFCLLLYVWASRPIQCFSPKIKLLIQAFQLILVQIHCLELNYIY